MRIRLLTVLAGIAVTMVSSYGATVQLNDGSIVDGTVVRQTTRFIYLNTGGANYEISRADITWFSSTTMDHRLLDDGEVPGPCVGLNGIDCSFVKNREADVRDVDAVVVRDLNADAPAVQAEPDHRMVHPARDTRTWKYDPDEQYTHHEETPPSSRVILPKRAPDEIIPTNEPAPINTSVETPNRAIVETPRPIVEPNRPIVQPNQTVRSAQTVRPAPFSGPVSTVRPASPVAQPRTLPYDRTGSNELDKVPSAPPPAGLSPAPQLNAGPPYTNVPPAAGYEPVPPPSSQGTAAPAVRESSLAPNPNPDPHAAAVVYTPNARAVTHTEAEINRLREAIPHLSDAADLSDRSQAIETLHGAGDAGLSILVEDGLYNAIPSIRTRTADLLGTWAGQRALKPLIEAFYAGAYATIPSYQTSYMQMLAGQISRLSGQDYYFYSRRSARAPELAASMLSWWDQNWEQMPAQIGEGALDPSHPNFHAMLKIERTPALIHRDFAGSNLPPEIAGPPQVNSPGEQEFLRSIPVIPRGSINSYVDRANSGQEPSVLKSPDPALSAPGRFRDELYAERLRANELNAASTNTNTSQP